MPIAKWQRRMCSNMKSPLEFPDIFPRSFFIVSANAAVKILSRSPTVRIAGPQLSVSPSKYRLLDRERLLSSLRVESQLSKKTLVRSTSQRHPLFAIRPSMFFPRRSPSIRVWISVQLGYLITSVRAKFVSFQTYAWRFPGFLEFMWLVGALASGVHISPPGSLNEPKRSDEEDTALFLGEDPKY